LRDVAGAAEDRAMSLPWVCLAAALAAALAGCEAEAGDNTLGVCSAVCRCTAGALPSQQRACMDQCLQVPILASSACEVCVFENANVCTHLIDRCFSAIGDPCLPGPGPDPGPVPPSLDEPGADL
jgi:hypothetical protein